MMLSSHGHRTDDDRVQVDDDEDGHDDDDDDDEQLTSAGRTFFAPLTLHDYRSFCN